MFKTLLSSSSIKSALSEVGDIGLFAGRFFREVFVPPFEFKELIRQCYNLLNRSLLLVMVTGFILGLVFALQSRPTIDQFGAESWIPSIIIISIIHEIGSVIIALICAGRVGSEVGGELGSMSFTEQIDAMEVSDTNPFKYVVVTHIVASTLTLPPAG